MRIVLASSSPYRKLLLERLSLDFEVASPGIDETPRTSEKPADMVMRLARNKAESLATTYTNSLIIGSDQCAVIDGYILGKPNVFDQAFAQLKRASGNTVDYFTSICVLHSQTGEMQLAFEINQVTYRPLTDQQIEEYLRKEQPYNCAGSFRSEGLGISLVETICGKDPNALIGLPLIKLVSMLKNFGVDVI